MSPFVGWQGIPSASLSQVRIASLKLLTAPCPLCASGALLVCLVLDTLPSYLSLSDPTIGFGLPPLCDHSFFSMHAQACLLMFTQNVEVVGVD